MLRLRFLYGFLAVCSIAWLAGCKKDDPKTATDLLAGDSEKTWKLTEAAYDDNPSHTRETETISELYTWKFNRNGTGAEFADGETSNVTWALSQNDKYVTLTHTSGGTTAGQIEELTENSLIVRGYYPCSDSTLEGESCYEELIFKPL